MGERIEWNALVDVGLSAIKFPRAFPSIRLRAQRHWRGDSSLEAAVEGPNNISHHLSGRYS